MSIKLLFFLYQFLQWISQYMFLVILTSLHILISSRWIDFLLHGDNVKSILWWINSLFVVVSFLDNRDFLSLKVRNCIKNIVNLYRNFFKVAVLILMDVILSVWLSKHDKIRRNNILFWEAIKVLGGFIFGNYRGYESNKKRK